MALSGGARIETGFPGSDDLLIEAAGATRAVLRYAPFDDYFMVRIQATPGTRWQIELDGVSPGAWGTVRPVIAAGSDPADPALYRAEVLARIAAPPPSATAERFPSTDGQAWRFVDRAWLEPIPATAASPHLAKRSRFLMEFTVPASTSLIAMRYPYTALWHERSLDRWRAAARQPGAAHHVIDLGRTRRGNAMGMIVVGGPGWQQQRDRPVLVMYAREHGTEPDSSWAVHGAVEFLISQHPRAAAIRERITTILMPCLDPDAADAPCYEHLVHAFSMQTWETNQITAVFSDLVNLGFPIDAVIDVHNIQGGQSQWHAFPVLSDPLDEFFAGQEAWIERALRPAFAERGYGFKKTLPDGSENGGFRLAGLLRKQFGAVLMGVELNMHARGRRLRLDEVQELGERFVTASATYLTSATQAAAARAFSTRLRLARARSFAANPTFLRVESRDRRLPKVEGRWRTPLCAEEDAAGREDDPDMVRTPMTDFLLANPRL